MLSISGRHGLQLIQRPVVTMTGLQVTPIGLVNEAAVGDHAKEALAWAVSASRYNSQVDCSGLRRVGKRMPPSNR
jgi:hypothetical protein